MNYMHFLVFALGVVLFIGVVAAEETDAAPSEEPIDDSLVPEDTDSTDTDAVPKDPDAIFADAAEAEFADMPAEGITRAYYGHGWATSGDNGYVVQALWFRNHVDNLDDLPEHVREMAMVGGGVLRVGVGSDARVYRLSKMPSSPDAITFALENVDSDADTSEGEFAIERDPYSEVSTWEGTIALPNADGTEYDKYYVDLGTRSVPVEDMDRVTQLIEQRNYNGFAGMKFIVTTLERVRSVFMQ